MSWKTRKAPKLNWCWFHTGQLLELHFHETRDMLIVNEGTPLKDGYERMERISRKTRQGRALT